MASIIELKAYIRFQLSQLKVQNKHHEFEQLTRHIANQTVCSNILPATGPVSSGGDQGRDAETFRTYIQSTPLASSSFVGRASDKTIVFCCSLEKEVEGKIKEDVKTVTSSGTNVEAVYCYCEADLPVGKRHKLQQWAKEEHKVELEVLDGNAIAELLTNKDIFWIAEEFLGVNSDMYPRSTEGGDAYQQYKQTWLIEQTKPNNFSDFSQIKYGLRDATFDDDLKPDLNSWIKIMELFLEPGVSPTLRRRAVYEICVASLRGLNRLSERRALIEEYFSSIVNMTELAELKDTSALLSYCSSATMQGAYDGDFIQLHTWTSSLKEQIDQLIATTSNPGIRCRLFDIRGYVDLLPFRDGPVPSRPDYVKATKHWNLLLDEVSKAPLYPLEGLSNFLVQISEFAEVSEELTELTHRVDELLVARSGEFLPAEKARDRAVIHLRRGNHLGAIKELHTAKVRWFSAETLRGSLLSMLILAESYEQLGLLYAAKYYASAAAFLAFHHHDERARPIATKALLTLATYSFQCGEWFTFESIMQCALIAHNTFDADPWNLAIHSHLQHSISHLMICASILRRFSPQASVPFEEALSKLPMPEDMKEAFAEMVSNKAVFWQTATKEEIVKAIAESTYAQPGSDLGQKRKIEWKALGIRWRAHFDNDYNTTIIAEEIISTLQIIAADIADKDLLFLPTMATVEISISQSSKCEIQNASNNRGGIWKISIPEAWVLKEEHRKELRQNIEVIAINIFAECSGIESNQLMATFEKMFANGLPSKVFSVRPYSDLYRQFILPEHFACDVRNELLPLFSADDFVKEESIALAWNDSLATNYSEAMAKEFLANRYRRSIIPIRLSLAKLMQNEAFRAQIHKLKSKGHRDWMILLIIMTLAVNYRGQKLFPGAPLKIVEKETSRLMIKEETEDDLEVPPDIFTDEALQLQEAATYAAIAKTWGLDLRNNCPDLDAWGRLLNIRFRNNLDDIEHDNFFDC